MRVLQEKVAAEKVLTILNTQYGIFLGLFIRSLFSVTGSQVPTVDVLLRNENYLPVTMWAVYLVFDWLTSNLTVAFKEQVNHLYLIALIGIITLLGSMPILAIDPNLRFYMLSAAYILVVPLWDLCLPLDEVTRSTGEQLHRSPSAAFLLLLMFSRLTCAIIFFAIILIHVSIGQAHIKSSLPHWFLIFMGTYLFLKLIRYLVYMDLGARMRIRMNQSGQASSDENGA